MEFRPTVFILVLLGLVALSRGAVDLNLRQLQYVSDHLTTKECRILITALWNKHFQLKPKELKPIEDNVPCLLHLTDWNKITGDQSTVEDLCVRLHQIGRTDVASDLAQAVYGETAREIHKYFLDDPFKKTAKHKGSLLMEDDDDEDEKKVAEIAVDFDRGADEDLDSQFHRSVICVTLSLTFLGLVVSAIYCRATCRTMCPNCLVDTWDGALESIHETLAKLKVLTITEGFGMRRESARVLVHPVETPQMRDEREKLMKSVMAI